jgi:mannosyl-3-phosphoglycerate phosphatase
LNVRSVIFSDVEILLESAASLTDEIRNLRHLITSQHVPLVLCSTRTRAEIESMHLQCGLQHPFICENGAAVWVPHGYFGFDLPNARRTPGYQVVEYGRPYSEVVRALDESARALDIDVRGFHSATIDEVARGCRSTRQAAQLAKLREYGEPFRIVSRHPEQRTRLFKALNRRGFGCAAGGRYDYVGAPIDEVVGIRLLCDAYERVFGPIVSIGVGDPVRDIGLLQFVRTPILTRRVDDDAPPPLIMKRPAKDARKHGASAPSGWRWLVSRLAGRQEPHTVDSAPAAALDHLIG